MKVEPHAFVPLALVAQGSAAAALMTTAGLVSSQVAAENLRGVKVALVVFVVAALLWLVSW